MAKLTEDEARKNIEQIVRDITETARTENDVRAIVELATLQAYKRGADDMIEIFAGQIVDEIRALILETEVPDEDSPRH